MEGGSPEEVQMPVRTCTYPVNVPCPRESYIKLQIKNHCNRSRERGGNKGKALYSTPYGTFFPCFLNKGLAFSFCPGRENSAAMPAVPWSDHVSL